MQVKKTIITAALTGAVTPAGYSIPATPAEIAAEAYDVYKLGAAVVHLHMRDDNGIGTMDAAKFKETIFRIRSYKDCDVVINCTSSGDATASEEARMLHMKTLDGIEMGTYDAGSMNWYENGIFLNTPPFLRSLASVYSERNIKPEIELFDAGMINNTLHAIKKGYLSAPCHFQFCLGVLGGMPATVENLVYMYNHIPEGSTWSAFGVGPGHLPILYATLALGGHVRVGMEDNVVFGFTQDGKRINGTNHMFVQRAVETVRAFGNEPATPAEARKILGLPPFDGEAIRAKLGIE